MEEKFERNIEQIVENFSKRVQRVLYLAIQHKHQENDSKDPVGLEGLLDGILFSFPIEVVIRTFQRTNYQDMATIDCSNYQWKSEATFKTINVILATCLIWGT